MSPFPWRELPGAIGVVIMTLISSFWVLWSTGEFFYEGWGTSFPGPFVYLVPGGVAVLLNLAAIRWPFVGGGLLVVVGVGFGGWWLGNTIGAGGTATAIVIRFLMSGVIAVIGLLFFCEGVNRRRKRSSGPAPRAGWWRRNAWYVVALAPPAIIVIGFAVFWVPILATRQDDGNRGARLVEGNGVSLVWAPEGPGWNWKQDFGGYPSWESLALYGQEPLGLERKRERAGPRASRADMDRTGLCRHLSGDGRTLHEAPPGIWRLPTADEMIRSLTIHGENAGCVLPDAFPETRFTRAVCARRPDKETPLWAPDREPIYYWVADEFGDDMAFFVNYQGAINAQPKWWGNPRHGYRCVRDP